MLDVYKYLNNIYKTTSPEFQINRNRSQRENSFTLVKKRHRLSLRGNYFTERVVNDWNSLPENVVSATSLNSFKARLDKFWEDLPTIHNPECYSV